MVRDDRRMPLREHLNELRRTLIRCSLVLVVLIFVGIAFDDALLRFMCQPWLKVREALSPPNGARDPGALTYISAGEGMMSALRVSFLFSVAVGAPFFIWELWRFIGVGLLPKERRAVRNAFLPGLLLFLVGLWFGFEILLPVGLQAMVSYISPDIAVSNVTLGNYLQLVVSMTLIMGAVFELPLIMWAVVRAGLVSRATLSKSRRAVIVGAAVLAAVITPTTDAINMLLVFFPLILLFELGLILCRMAERRQDRLDEGQLG
jgi:sec-independent protein translocase protein TatC